MLSYTCKTAIKAALFLATKSGEEIRSSIKEIAEVINASEHTSAKMLQLLARQKIISSVKGPSGGFYMTSQQVNEPVMNIVAAIDGKNSFNECGLGLSTCSATHPCPIHNQYKEAREKIKSLFERTTVNDLAAGLKSGNAFIADEIQ